MRRCGGKAQKPALWVLGSLLALILIFSPSLYTFGWHLRYGSMLAYKGKRVPVPANWIADAEPQGLTLTKLPSTLFFLFGFDWLRRWISISKFAPLRTQTLQEAEESFEKAFYTYPPAPPDAVLSGPIRMGTPPNDVFCMKATFARGAGPVILQCMLQQGTWNAHFVGEEKDVGTFYAVVCGLK